MGKYKSLILNTLLFAVNAVATKLITFILVPLYTYYMSAAEYGVADMSLTVINLVTPLATFSIADAAVRFIVANRKRGDEYTAISMAVTLLSVVIVSVLSPLLNLDAFGGLGTYRALFILAYASSAFMNMCSEVARGMGEIKLIPVCAGISSITTLLVALVLIGRLDMSIAGYFLSVSLGPIIACVLYLSVGGLGASALNGFRSLLRSSRSGFVELIRPMLLYALPLIPNNLFWWLSSGINRLFITGMMGIAASGMFAAASKIPNLLNTAYTVFQQAWQLSAFQESGKEDIGKFFSSVFCMLQSGMTILCSLISFFSIGLASVMLQGETFAAWPMISILLLSNLFNVFASFYGTVYSTTMHTSFIMKTTVFGAISCVVLTPLLIPVLGITGACVASAIGQFLVFIMRTIDSRKYINFYIGWKYLLPTLMLLFVQAVVTSGQFVGWRAISGLCSVMVIVIQLANLAHSDVARIVTNRLHR